MLKNILVLPWYNILSTDFFCNKGLLLPEVHLKASTRPTPIKKKQKNIFNLLTKASLRNYLKQSYNEKKQANIP